MALEDILWKLTVSSLVVGAILAGILAFICSRWIDNKPYVIIFFGIIGFVLGAALGSLPFLASLFS